MGVAYGARGLIGLLTPQANTTVEPEMAIMTPPGMAVVNARLKSDKPTIAERLGDYFAHYEDALGEFANAPLTAVGFACTGASYIGGPAAEDRMRAAIEAKRGFPAITAASAGLDALAVLGATRIALVSPYPGPLDEASARYWTARGLTVAARRSAFQESDAFHPIYSLDADAAQPGIDAVAREDVDAIVLLGTGMPTLERIARTPLVNGKPLLSCMAALGWRLRLAAGREAPSRENLMAFLKEDGWRARLEAMRG